MTTEEQFRLAYSNACRAIASPDRLNQIVGEAYKKATTKGKELLIRDEVSSSILLTPYDQPLPINQ
jgi:hypothetical protein